MIIAAAKQEAFEEVCQLACTLPVYQSVNDTFIQSIRLKNQFRTLDEDEVEFLDSVLESTRAKEAAVRKETSEQLDAFRKQQEEAERAAALAEINSGTVPQDEEQWVASGRKRKKGREKEQLKGVKLRKLSSTSEKSPVGLSTTPTSTATPVASAGKSASPAVEAKPRNGQSTGNVSKGEPPAAAELPLETPPKVPPKTNGPSVLGLSGYSSDDDE